MARTLRYQQPNIGALFGASAGYLAMALAFVCASMVLEPWYWDRQPNAFAAVLYVLENGAGFALLGLFFVVGLTVWIGALVGCYLMLAVLKAARLTGFIAFAIGGLLLGLILGALFVAVYLDADLSRFGPALAAGAVGGVLTGLALRLASKPLAAQ